MQFLWLPAIRAQLALREKNPTSALHTLQPASPIELGETPFGNNISCLYPVYTRGEAYLAAGQGAAAASEFQKILERSGIVWNCWTRAAGRSDGRKPDHSLSLAFPWRRIFSKAAKPRSKPFRIGPLPGKSVKNPGLNAVRRRCSLCLSRRHFALWDLLQRPVVIHGWPPAAGAAIILAAVAKVPAKSGSRGLDPKRKMSQPQSPEVTADSVRMGPTDRFENRCPASLRLSLGHAKSNPGTQFLRFPPRL